MKKRSEQTAAQYALVLSSLFYRHGSLFHLLSILITLNLFLCPRNGNSPLLTRHFTHSQLSLLRFPLHHPCSVIRLFPQVLHEIIARSLSLSLTVSLFPSSQALSSSFCLKSLHACTICSPSHLSECISAQFRFFHYHRIHCFLHRYLHVAATPVFFIISMADSPHQDDARVAALCQRLGRLWPEQGVDIWEDEVSTEKQKLNRKQLLYSFQPLSFLISIQKQGQIKQNIHQLCSSLLLLLTCLHAPSIYHHRQQVWTDIKQIRTSSSFPWVCIGDYNDILYHRLQKFLLSQL